MKCRVADAKGNNIPISDSIIRYFSKWLSTLALGIGYLMIIWDNKKQGLHDKIAETFVVINLKSNVKENIKKILIVATLIIVAGYALFYIFLLAIGFFAALQADLKEIDSTNVINSTLDICDSKIPYYEDTCIWQLSQKEEMEKLSTASKLELCSNINSKQLHSQCISAIAVLERNQSICNNAKSNYYITVCKKTYNFSTAIVDYLLKEKELEFNGTLNVGEAKFGLLAGQKCIETEEYKFLQEDYFCFEVYNVTPFTKGKDGLNWYDIEVKKFDDKENLIYYSKQVYWDDGHVNLKNNILDNAGMNLRLNETSLGTYMYQIAIYDRISNKGTYFNKTIEVIEKPKENLTIEYSVLGVITSGENCATKHQYIYTNKDIACIKVFNVSRFDKTKDGFNLFDMDLLIRDSSGNTVDESRNTWGEKGLLVLRNNLFNAYDEWPYGVSHFFGILSPGEYSFELTVRDRISKKQAKVIKYFMVVESKAPLKAEDYTLGYYDGYNCIERRTKAFSNEETVCLMPYISGFEYDSDGYSYFNMDHMVLNSQGSKISFFENAFDQQDEKINPPLADYFVYTHLYDLPLGQYVYEATIRDLISKETVTITATFTIEDIKFNLY